MYSSTSAAVVGEPLLDVVEVHAAAGAHRDDALARDVAVHLDRQRRPRRPDACRRRRAARSRRSRRASGAGRSAACPRSPARASRRSARRRLMASGRGVTRSSQKNSPALPQLGDAWFVDVVEDLHRRGLCPRRRMTRRAQAASDSGAGVAGSGWVSAGSVARRGSISTNASDRAEQRDHRADAQAVVERVDERVLQRAGGAAAGVRRPRPSRARRSASSAPSPTGSAAARRAGGCPAPRSARPSRRRRTCRRPSGSSRAIPEATPAFDGSTEFIAAVLIGDITRPMPKPISTNAPASEAVGRVDGEVALPEQRAGDQQQAGGHQRPRADAVGQAPGDRAGDDDHERRGQEAHAGLAAASSP